MRKEMRQDATDTFKAVLKSPTDPITFIPGHPSIFVSGRVPYNVSQATMTSIALSQPIHRQICGKDFDIDMTQIEKVTSPVVRKPRF